MRSGSIRSNRSPFTRPWGRHGVSRSSSHPSTAEGPGEEQDEASEDGDSGCDVPDSGVCGTAKRCSFRHAKPPAATVEVHDVFPLRTCSSVGKVVAVVANVVRRDRFAHTIWRRERWSGKRSVKSLYVSSIIIVAVDEFGTCVAVT